MIFYTQDLAYLDWHWRVRTITTSKAKQSEQNDGHTNCIGIDIVRIIKYMYMYL